MLQHSLRAQLFSLLGASLALILLAAIACFSLFSGSLQAYHSLISGPIQQSRDIDAANLAFKEQVQEWKDVLLRGKDASAQQRHWSRFEALERDVQSRLNELAQRTNDPALKGRIERLRNEHQNLGTLYRKGREAFNAAGAEASVGDRAVSGIDRASSEQMNALVTELHQHSKQQIGQINARADRDFWLSIGIIITIIIATGLLSQWVMSRNLIEPIRHLIAYIKNLSQGQFEQQISSNRSDELGELAKAANALRDFLADTSAGLHQSTRNIDSTCSELNSIASQMASGTRDQFSRTDQVATAMHEMSATSQEVASYAANAARAADEAELATQHGEAAMKTMIASINTIRDEITSTAQVIGTLQTDSARIGEVLEVIRGIAEQTNLLALNAAIEAARAGEQGRGFAVVADEVRSLAQRTAESTAEINQMISAVQSGALNAVRAIDNGQRSSEDGVNQVTKTGEILRAVTHSVEQMRDMNRQIATAAEEQTSVAEDISRNLSEITSIANTNQHSVERTQVASQTLQQLSAELAHISQRLGA